MNIRTIASLVIALPWGLLVMAGFGGVANVQAQHVPGYPSVEQIECYVAMPGAACLLGLIGAGLSLRRKSATTPVIGFVLATALFPYLFMYGGGM